MNRSPEREQFLADIITCAVEGGGVWARFSGYRWDGIPSAECRATLHDMEDGESYPLTIDAVARGIGLIVRGDVGVNRTLRGAILYADRENDAGEIDADAADVIVQAGLLGDVVYG